MVRMAEAGATVPMIASVTGWEIAYCQSIVDTYLPRRSEMAAMAIEVWEGAAQLLRKPGANCKPDSEHSATKVTGAVAPVARPTGLEPVTHSLEGCCSIQLS